jgi:hypothetical protein
LPASTSSNSKGLGTALHTVRIGLEWPMMMQVTIHGMWMRLINPAMCAPLTMHNF